MSGFPVAMGFRRHRFSPTGVSTDGKQAHRRPGKGHHRVAGSARQQAYPQGQSEATCDASPFAGLVSLVRCWLPCRAGGVRGKIGMDRGQAGRDLPMRHRATEKGPKAKGARMRTLGIFFHLPVRTGPTCLTDAYDRRSHAVQQANRGLLRPFSSTGQKERANEGGRGQSTGRNSATGPIGARCRFSLAQEG